MNTESPLQVCAPNTVSVSLSPRGRHRLKDVGIKEMAEMSSGGDGSDTTCPDCGKDFDNRGLLGAHLSRTDCSDDQFTAAALIDDIQRVAEEIGETPTMADIRELGEYGRSTYQREFGSWNEALIASGFEPNTRRNIPEQELLDELKRLSEMLGRTPYASDMEEKGKFSKKTYSDRFGSWLEALRTVGLEMRDEQRTEVPEEEWLAEIERLAEELDRVPASTEMDDLGKYSAIGYQGKFGSWGEAVRKAGFEPINQGSVALECEWCSEEFERRASVVEENEHHLCSQDCLNEWRGAEWPHKGEDHYNFKGGSQERYGPGWKKQRQKALERDDHECQHPGCDTRQEEHRDRFGKELSVHHIMPRRAFVTEDGFDYESANQLDNLVVLCEQHHKTWEGMAPLTPGGLQ